MVCSCTRAHAYANEDYMPVNNRMPSRIPLRSNRSYYPGYPASHLFVTSASAPHADDRCKTANATRRRPTCRNRLVRTRIVFLTLISQRAF